MLTLDDFRQVELRIGEVVGAQPIPGSDRLLRLTVDLGDEQRQLVGGLAQGYPPRQLEGKRVVVVANMTPATIRGEVSEGMLLGVGCDDPRGVALLTVDRPVPNGARVE